MKIGLDFADLRPDGVAQLIAKLLDPSFVQVSEKRFEIRNSKLENVIRNPKFEFRKSENSNAQKSQINSRLLWCQLLFVSIKLACCCKLAVSLALLAAIKRRRSNCRTGFVWKLDHHKASQPDR